jgi:hypothetical protein
LWRSEQDSDWGIEMVVTQRSGKTVKRLAAVVGGGALVAIGVMSAIIGGGGSAAHVTLSVGVMTMGATQTADYAKTSIETTMAVPAAKATPPCGFSSSC